MKKQITIILLLFLQITFAQQNIEVTYKAKEPEIKFSDEQKQFLGKESAANLMEDLKENRLRINDIVKDFEYTLKANPEESFYAWEEQIRDETVSERDFKTAINQGGTGKFYQNIKRNIAIHQRKRNGVYKRYYRPLRDTAWVITKETDTILGYPVIKATKTTVLKKTLDPMLPKVLVKEAWFAPDLPMPFGPEGIGGLPGLVLRYGRVVATKIKILKKTIKIKEPKKGVLIDEIEAYKKSLAATNKMLAE